jgi:starvation-inducible DNA-binding protein
MTQSSTEPRLGPHPLDVDDRLAVGEQLQELLVNLTDLALTGKQAHWNLRGPRFHSIHLQLDGMVDEYRESSDTIAERLLALGVSADARAATVARDTNLPEFPEGRIGDEQVIELMAERLLTAIRQVRRRLDLLGELDPVSQDLVNGVLEILEKQHWMMESSKMA